MKQKQHGLASLFLLAASASFLAASAWSESAAPNRAFQDCERCPAMLIIPAGNTMMGTSDSEWRREGYAKPPQVEMPAHRVTVKSFALSKFEVTRDQYAIFAKATERPDPGVCEHLDAQNNKVPVKGGSYRNTSLPHASGNEPVSCVSWEDASAYTKWLSQQTGRAYRLPTEAEWEYAARAGTATARYWEAGESRDSACQYGSVADLSLARGLGGIGVSDAPENVFQCDDKFIYLAPVGSFRPNAFGLHDMLGNVSEWVQDCVHASYVGAPTDGTVWDNAACVKEGGKTLRIARGGAFGTDANKTRAAWRARLQSAAFHTGFRVAMSLDPPKQ